MKTYQIRRNSLFYFLYVKKNRKISRNDQCKMYRRSNPTLLFELPCDLWNGPLLLSFASKTFQNELIFFFKNSLPQHTSNMDERKWWFNTCIEVFSVILIVAQSIRLHYQAHAMYSCVSVMCNTKAQKSNDIQEFWHFSRGNSFKIGFYNWIVAKMHTTHDKTNRIIIQKLLWNKISPIWCDFILIYVLLNTLLLSRKIEKKRGKERGESSTMLHPMQFGN